MNNNLAIKVDNLKKSYNKFIALKGISFEVPIGSIFTIVGPNGAGKTTTVEILEGIRKFDEGQISILGNKIGSKFVKENIGVQLQDGQLMENLKPIEILNLYRSFYNKGFDSKTALKLVDLEHKKNTLIKNLSGGESKRLQIALAVINDPSIIFLDEPTTGLDPNSRRKLWDIILKFKQNGKTIILTTHYMDEAEELSDIVLIINKGNVIAKDTPTNLILNSNIENKISISFTKSSLNKSNFQILDSFFTNFKSEIKKIINIENKYIIYTNYIESFLEQFFLTIRNTSLKIENIFIKHPSLEDVFLLKTGQIYKNNSANNN